MHPIIPLLLVATLAACTPPNNPTSAEPKPISSENNSSHEDSFTSTFPVQIGNEKGSVKIVGIRRIQDKTITNRTFTISLEGIKEHTLSKQIDRATFEQFKENALSKDAIGVDFWRDMTIQRLEFDFVRGNTLYFTAILKNRVAQKAIAGRFSVFYSSSKKGQVYGWITDEVQDLSN